MDKIAEPERATKAIPTCFGQLRDLVDEHSVRALKWYEKHTGRPWLWFRVCGTLLIVLSLCLPVLSSLSFPDSPPAWFPPRHWFPSRYLLVSFVALAIALLSGLGTFFHWHETWRVHIRAMLEIRHLIAMWEVRMIEAQQRPDPDAQTEAAIKATKELFDAVAKADINNAEGYFKNVQFPEEKK